MSAPDAITRLEAPMTRAHISWVYEYGRTHGGQQLLRRSLIRREREQNARFGHSSIGSIQPQTTQLNPLDQQKLPQQRNSLQDINVDQLDQNFIKARKLTILTRD